LNGQAARWKLTHLHEFIRAIETGWSAFVVREIVFYWNRGVRGVRVLFLPEVALVTNQLCDFKKLGEPRSPQFVNRMAMMQSSSIKELRVCSRRCRRESASFNTKSTQPPYHHAILETLLQECFYKLMMLVAFESHVEIGPNQPPVNPARRNPVMT
jgi:hypothetical protein